MFIGYARVSTAEQTLALQENALQQLVCEKNFRDVMPGSTTERSGLYLFNRKWLWGTFGAAYYLLSKIVQNNLSRAP